MVLTVSGTHQSDGEDGPITPGVCLPSQDAGTAHNPDLKLKLCLFLGRVSDTNMN